MSAIADEVTFKKTIQGDGMPSGEPRPAPASPLRAAELPPESSLQARLLAVKAARNPLLEAAQPLLRARADMPLTLQAEDIEPWRRLLGDAFF